MDQIEELLTRGVANIIPGKDELEKVLRAGKPLNVYCGFDVTAPALHIGNSVPLRKLQQFVKLGHNVTFLIGDFTTLVGDTSDKDTERPVIPEDKIDEYWQTYSAQAGKILDLSRVTVRHNSEWLGKLTPKDFVKFMRRFSLNDFISRELIKNRLAAGNSVNLSEVIYPILQGYDSYFMDTDIQVGATDQTFNMQAGRILQKQLRNKDTFVISFEFLMGTDGRKMSKTWGNAIWLTDEPNDMYGQVMSLKDELINQYFLLATNLPLGQIPHDTHPLDRKKQLAWQIVSELHGPEAAQSAQNHFASTIQQKEIPTSLPNFNFPGPIPILDAIVATGLASSKSDARRLMDQGGIKINGQKVSDYKLMIEKASVISAGARSHAKIIIGS
jgi:tyrosyl-tRNA synthetase